MKSVMFGSFFVACFLIKERKVGVNELIVGPHLFGLVAFSNGCGVIAYSIVSHSQSKLGVEVIWVFRQHGFELGDGDHIIALGVIEHRFVVLFLQCWHNAFDYHWYGTIDQLVQAETRIVRHSTAEVPERV